MTYSGYILKCRATSKNDLIAQGFNRPIFLNDMQNFPITLAELGCRCTKVNLMVQTQSCICLYNPQNVLKGKQGHRYQQKTFWIDAESAKWDICWYVSCRHFSWQMADHIDCDWPVNNQKWWWSCGRDSISLRRWMGAGPEIVRVAAEFKICLETKIS